ncbi:MAG: amidase [Pseudonocardia sp.]
MSATQPHELTAVQQAAAIRVGELDPVELVEHHLRRIDRLDPGLAAFVTLTPERALDAARAARRLLADTRDPKALPPLLGVPTAIKDLAVTAGVRTTFGSPVYAENVPDVDDDSARLLREAGMISLGKTAVPEFGLPPYTEPAGRPPTVTPWDPTRSAGGSSGGAGAAVAAGLVPVAHGTDGGGSIRIPASVNGLVGLKTSRGLVSRGPLGGDPLGLSVSGPLARTPADAAAMLDALAVPVPSEPWARPTGRADTPSGFAAAARRADPGRLRIGRYATPALPGVTVHPDCLAAWEHTSTLLADLGHEVVDAELGLAAGTETASAFVAVFETLWAVLAHGSVVPDGADGQLRPLTNWWRARGARVSGPEFLAAAQAAQLASRFLITAHAAYDVVLTPTLALPPRPVGWFTEGPAGDVDPALDYARQQAFTPFTAIYNITGQPALSLPLGWSPGPGGSAPVLGGQGAGGPAPVPGDPRPDVPGPVLDGPAPDGSAPVLPIGVQLVGGPGTDGLLLELGAQLAAAAPWDDRHPPTW